MEAQPRSLGSVLSGLVDDPAERAAFGDDPAGFLAERGFPELSDRAVAEAVCQVADTLTAPVAEHLAPQVMAMQPLTTADHAAAGPLAGLEALEALAALPDPGVQLDHFGAEGFDEFDDLAGPDETGPPDGFDHLDDRGDPEDLDGLDVRGPAVTGEEGEPPGGGPASSRPGTDEGDAGLHDAGFGRGLTDAVAQFTERVTSGLGEVHRDEALGDELDPGGMADLTEDLGQLVGLAGKDPSGALDAVSGHAGTQSRLDEDLGLVEEPADPDTAWGDGID